MSHDLAEVTTRPGTRAAEKRANSPVTRASGRGVIAASHGSSSEPGGNSLSIGAYTAEGRSGRAPRSPGRTTWGIWKSRTGAAAPAAGSVKATAQLEVPRSMPMM